MRTSALRSSRAAHAFVGVGREVVHRGIHTRKHIVHGHYARLRYLRANCSSVLHNTKVQVKEKP